MTSTVNKEDGRKLTGCMVYCLRANAGRPMFGWFELTDAEKKALKDMLKAVMGKDIEMDMDGLKEMLKTFLDITNPETMDERDGRSWGDVANNTIKIAELQSDKDGRKAWYMSLKGDNDPVWDGDTEPDAKEQCYLGKLRTVAKRGTKHLEKLQERWDKAENLVALHKRFRQIANTHGPGQTVLNLQLGHLKKEVVLADIGEGNTKVTEWAEGISNYFGIGRAGEFLDAMKFFFPGPGYDLITQIDWTALKGYIEAKDIRAVRMVSNEVKAADQFEDVNSTLTTLGDTMLKINQLDGGPAVSEKDKKEAERKKGIRDDFKEAMRKWDQEIVGKWYRDGDLKQLEADKHKLIRYNEIIKTLSTT